MITDIPVPDDTERINVATDDEYATFRIGGQDRWKNRIWQRDGSSEARATCPICDQSIGRKDALTGSVLNGEVHHLVNRSHFPSKHQTSGGAAVYERWHHKSAHHPSNLALMCRRCHRYLEGIEGARPHLMSWLFSDITGDEVPLILPEESRVRSQQRRNWSVLQREVERKRGYECRACEKVSHDESSHTLSTIGGNILQYTGPSVRAVHIIPPLVAPALTHDPDNLVMLCWNCLFGPDRRREFYEERADFCWHGAPVQAWINEFIPTLEWVPDSLCSLPD